MSEVIAKVGQAVAERALTEGSKNAGVGSSQGNFAELLQEKLDQSDRTGSLRNEILKTFGMAPNEPEMKAISAEGLEIKTQTISGGQEIRTNGKVLDLLSGFNREMHQMESTVDLVGSQKELSPRSLLQIQAGLAMNVLHLELLKSVVEQGNTGVKTLLNTSFA